MEIRLQRDPGGPSNYFANTVDINVTDVDYPSEAQIKWKHSGAFGSKAISVANTSAQPVTVKFNKYLGFNDDEPALDVAFDDEKEFEISAGDESIFNFDRIFSRLDIFLKSGSSADVKVSISGRA